MIRNLVALLLSVFAVVSCGSDKTREDYGLTVIEIRLPEDRKNDFLADFRGDVPYEAEIRINGQENQGTISPAGSTSISLYKKSLDCEIESGSRDAAGTGFRLSAQKTDTSLLRSIVGFEFYRRIGLPVPDVEPVVVYLNGELWGLYIKIEKIDENFFERRNTKVDFMYKADNGAAFDQVSLQRPNNVFDVKIGEKNFEYVKEITYLLEDSTNPRNQAILNKMIDLDSVRQLTRGITLISHWDSVFNNFHLYRIKGGKKFYALAWDLDAIFDLEGHPFSPGYVESSYNRLFRYAIQTDLNSHLTSLRSDLNSHFNGATLDSIANPAIARMREAYAADPVLGGAGFSIDAEYAQLKADALNWWNSVDQELTTRGF